MPFYQAQRVNEFYRIFFALSILNIGWLLIAVDWTRRQIFNVITCGKTNVITCGKTQASLLFLPALGILSLAAWCLLMFGPGPNVIIVHAGSYGTMLVLFVGLGAWLAKSPAWLKHLTLVVQSLLFLTVWILPPSPFPLSAPVRDIVTLDRLTNLYPIPNWFIGIYVLLFAGLIVMTLLKLVRLDSMPRASSRN